MTGARNDLLHEEILHAAHQAVLKTLQTMAETDLLRIIPSTGQKSLPKIFLNEDGEKLLRTLLSDFHLEPRMLKQSEAELIGKTHKIGEYLYTIDGGTFSHLSAEDGAPIFEGGLANACGSYENLMEALKPANLLPAYEKGITNIYLP